MATEATNVWESEWSFRVDPYGPFDEVFWSALKARPLAAGKEYYVRGTLDVTIGYMFRPHQYKTRRLEVLYPGLLEVEVRAHPDPVAWLQSQMDDALDRLATGAIGEADLRMAIVAAPGVPMYVLALSPEEAAAVCRTLPRNLSPRPVHTVLNWLCAPHCRPPPPEVGILGRLLG